MRSNEDRDTEVLYIEHVPAGTKDRLRRLGRIYHRSMGAQALAIIEEGAARLERKKRAELDALGGGKETA